MEADLTPEQIKLVLSARQLDALEEALHALTVCETHFRLRDKANAQLHLATPKYSPITRMVGRAARGLATFLDGSQKLSIGENSEPGEIEPETGPVDRTSE